MSELRPNQVEIIGYQQGKLGIIAVPGSGKTYTLSLLASRLIQRGELRPGQEILVVTLVNSAVDHFRGRVADFLRDGGLVPGYGYRVRTLHGLAHDIVRERPSLVGLSEGFTIVDELTSQDIVRELSRSWLRHSPESVEPYLDLNLSEKQRKAILRRDILNYIPDIIRNAIKRAKDYGLTPVDLARALDQGISNFPLLNMVAGIYLEYQEILSYRGAIDFDDLVGKAAAALKADPAYRKRLQVRWPYILEDEAQDSSHLQEQVLQLLVGPEGNWVRVGDPNQAIYETFTTADPALLRRFVDAEGVERKELPASGRSTKSIILLANHLIDWSQQVQAYPSLQGALQPPHIQPTPTGDPQPNPADNPQGIHLVDTQYTPEEEIEVVAKSIQRWIRNHPDKTIGVLVPTNRKGAEMAGALAALQVSHLELLRSSPNTRAAAAALANALEYIAAPTVNRFLPALYRYWLIYKGHPNSQGHREAEVWLQGQREPEDFLFPSAGDLGVLQRGRGTLSAETMESLQRFQSDLARWLEAAVLPIDQLILIICQDLFSSSEDVAIGYQLASMLGGAKEARPDWTMSDLIGELKTIVENRRSFLGLSREDRGFDPEEYKGIAVVTTVHKAKGLEWDRVHLLSVNEYDFPADTTMDRFISQKPFIRDGLDLQAEVLEQVTGLARGEGDDQPVEGEATMRAKAEYSAERLRLFYVGVTRARSELIITWNLGLHGDMKPSVPLRELLRFWEKQGADDETP